jgi:TIR domain
VARSGPRRKIRPWVLPTVQVKPPGEPTPFLVSANSDNATVQGTNEGKPVIFVSYSHRDRRWVDRLLVHLRPLERYGALAVFEDSRIRPGAKWYAEIEEALSNAAVAILVISADFLASDFVMKKEVPALLRNAESRGTAVIPLIAAPSLFGQSVLGCFQAINSPESPLSKLRPYQREEILVRLAESIASRIERCRTLPRDE